jgi:hypothetical protein
MNRKLDLELSFKENIHSVVTKDTAVTVTRHNTITELMVKMCPPCTCGMMKPAGSDIQATLLELRTTQHWCSKRPIDLCLQTIDSLVTVRSTK